MGQSVVRRALIGGTTLMGATVIQTGVGLAASIILARLLGPEAFGRFAIVLATISIVLALATLRLNVIIFRVPEEVFTARRRDIYFSVSLMEIVVTAVVATGWLLWLDLVDVLAAALIVSQVAVHWVSVNRAFFERGMPYKRLALIETTAVLLGHLVAVGAALMEAGVSALYLREVVTAASLAGGLVSIGGLTVRSFVWPSRAEWRDLFHEASPIWLDSVGEGAFHRLMLLMVARFSGESGAGWYFMAHSLASRPNQLLAPAVVRVASGWFRHQAEGAARARGRDFLLLTTTGPLVLTAAVAVAFADPLVPLVFGDSWRGAAPVLAALCGLIVFTTPFEILRAYSVIAGHTGALLTGRIAQYAAVGVGIPIAWLLGSADVVGISIVVSCSTAAAFIVLRWSIRHRERP